MTKLEPILLVPDCHIPYHDTRAFGLMLKVAADLKPKHIYIIGDFMDFYSVSDHSKDPKRALNLGKEIDAGNAALDRLDSLSAPSKTYIGGNHEDRLTRYLHNKAPELHDIVSIPDLLRLSKRKWKYVPYKSDCRLGKLNFTHDVGVAGRNSVFQCLDTYQHSIVTGHTHRLGYIVEGNAVGEHKLSAQFGWLGDAKAVDYLAKAKVNKNWALGFGVGYYNPKSGYVYMTPTPIVNYTCVLGGKLYSA